MRRVKSMDDKKDPLFLGMILSVLAATIVHVGLSTSLADAIAASRYAP